MIKLDAYERLETVDEKLAMLYQWVKTGHINLTQFKVLIRDLVMEVPDDVWFGVPYKT